MDTGWLSHLYYGPRIHPDPAALQKKHAAAPSNTVTPDQDHLNLSYEAECLEISSYGKGDIREPFITLIHEDGSRTSDFRYRSYEIRKGKEAAGTLPGSYGTEDEVETLEVHLTDPSYGTELVLYYYVFAGKDVIARRGVLINHEENTLVIDRFLSCQLDFCDSDYVLTSFHGAHNRDMYEKVSRDLTPGKIVNSVFAGASSNRVNPFFMLGRKDTGEDKGLAFGFHLVYSGNHYAAAEVSAFDQTRIVYGLSPEGFSWTLSKGDSFETPEAVFSVTEDGFNGLSQNLHGFIKNHILRGEWSKKERPVLLNSWEAAYFDITEASLLKLAKEAAKAGVELFVMDDGWFGTRNDDTSSLGDWEVNVKKLPTGIGGIASKIEKLGLKFGLWVEPEMVNTDSDLFRAHPDWTLSVPGKDHAEGRNQRYLDLCNPEVTEYVIREMSRIFSEEGVSYVKWDMNRIVSDAYSPSLPPERQGETLHRYMLGLYHILDVLFRKFPHILFEGCASGGGRFDLGMLSYFPQIWASDNTDALCRVRIQTNYSYGYPLCTLSNHVSACPNHQTMRSTPLSTRFSVAAFGVLGYECNLKNMNKKELEEIKEEIGLYKRWRKVLQYGSFYRGRNGNLHEWTVVSKDRNSAVGFLMQELVTPNLTTHRFYAKGLMPNTRYRFTNRSVPITDLLKGKEALLQETEELTAYGDLLMKAGAVLTEAHFTADEPKSVVRYFPDFSSRLYFMEKE